MPNVNDMFPSTYLKASDLKGKEPVVTIKEIAYEPVGQKREMKPIVYFQKVPKGLVLNKTNANRITQIAGSGITEEWVGVQVRLYVSAVEFQGETVDAIRIRPVTASKANAVRPSTVLPNFPPKTAPAAAPAGPFDDQPDPDRQPLEEDDEPIPFTWLLPFVLLAPLVGRMFA